MAEVMSLQEHLTEELRDLLDAEQQITRGLPQFAQATSTPVLRAAFEKHLRETNRHLERLRKALRALGETARAKRCDGMRGLLTEGNAHMRSAPKGALRDAMMIASAQKVEHYEMAAYGTARTYAELLGRSDIARLLADTLAEEKTTDAKLTEIAESAVNRRAAEEWHRQNAGLVERSAEWLGHTVGLARRQLREVAAAAAPGRHAVEQAARSAAGGVREVKKQTTRAVRSVAASRPSRAPRRRSPGTGTRRRAAKKSSRKRRA